MRFTVTNRQASYVSAFALVTLLACGEQSQAPDPARPAVVDLKSGQGTSCALLDDGSLWCWGRGIGAVAAASDTAPQRQPIPDSVTSFAIGDASICAATGAGATYCWGYWYPIDVGRPYGDLPTLLTDTLRLTGLSSASGHTCGILPSTELACWGSSVLGKRGLGVPDTSLGNTTPNLVIGATGYVAVVTGGAHTCGLVESGGLVTCWGLGSVLGDSSSVMQFSSTACFWSTSCALSPVLVTSLSGIHHLSAGGASTCAAGGTGAGTTVWCWGWLYGGLATRPVVVPLPEATNRVTVGNTFACAVSVTGTAYCWGEPGPWLGHHGITGAPAPVETSLKFTLLSAGTSHVCGLTTTGAVYCWGDSDQGALDGPTFEPILVRGPW